MRLRLWLPVVLPALIGGATALWFGYLEPFETHRRWSQRVQKCIKQMAYKRPPDVSKGQWEFVHGWTINLHGNCGMISESVDGDWRDGFADEFEQRLAGPFTLSDIEWVWDEYARHTRGGQRYSDNYRPTRADEFRGATAGCFGHPVD